MYCRRTFLDCANPAINFLLLTGYLLKRSELYNRYRLVPWIFPHKVLRWRQDKVEAVFTGFVPEQMTIILSTESGQDVLILERNISSRRNVLLIQSKRVLGNEIPYLRSIPQERTAF